MTNQDLTPSEQQASNKHFEKLLRALIGKHHSDIQYPIQDEALAQKYRDIAARVFGNAPPKAPLSVTRADAKDLNYLQIYDSSLLKELSDRPSIGREERRFYSSLQFLSAEKPLKEVTDTVIRSMENLFGLFPNARELLQYVYDFLHLRKLATTEKAIYFPPVCITGAPGIGKTAVIKGVCKALGVDYAFYDMSAASSSWGLGGQDSAWSGSHPGLVLKTLIYGTCANPAIHLDELDKCQINHNTDPYLILHTLLERPQMVRFIDGYAQNLALDAHYIMFMSTANNVEAIPATIRTRLKIIELQPPSPKEMKVISMNMYRTLLEREDVKQAFHEHLDEAVLGFLSTKTPRQVGLILARGLAAAATRKHKNGLHHINVDDCITIDDQEPSFKKMGFLWT